MQLCSLLTHTIQSRCVYIKCTLILLNAEMIGRADNVRAVANDFNIIQRLVKKLPEKYRVQERQVEYNSIMMIKFG